MIAIEKGNGNFFEKLGINMKKSRRKLIDDLIEKFKILKI